MKTSVEINEEKLLIAKKLSDTITLRETIDLALDALIAQQRRFSMLNIIGTPFFEGDLRKMRSSRVSPRR